MLIDLTVNILINFSDRGSVDRRTPNAQHIKGVF
jgi:hypothetical protein